MLLFIFLILAGIWAYYFIFYKKKKDIAPAGKPILITGAASGIGKATALQLIKEGCFVFAADINDKLLKENFDKMDNVKTIVMDVTDEKSVKQARKVVEQEGKGLYGIVNSAGIVGGGKPGVYKIAVELDTDTEVRKVIEINLLGTMRVNNNFHDLLLESKGCFVNIASVAGRLCAGGIGPYAASKHGVEGYSKALRCELAPFGVRVVVMEPGFIDTPLVQQYHDLEWDFSKTSYKLLTQKQMDELLEQQKKISNPPELVANEISRCLFSSKLAQTHVVVDTALRKIFWSVGSLIPEPIITHFASKAQTKEMKKQKKNK